MKLHHPAAAGALALLLTVPGIGLAADKTYDNLPPFTGVKIASGIDAIVTVGPAQSIVGSAPNADHLNEIKVEVRDGTLRVWRDWDFFELFGLAGRDTQVRFTIAAPTLDSADASSGADVEVSGLAGETVWLEASSGAGLKATDIQATSIDVDASSGGTVTANGTCTDLEVESSSGASANLNMLACTNAEAEASSGASTSISIGGDLRAEASSGASIKVKGTPKTTKIEESSGGSVSLGD